MIPRPTQADAVFTSQSIYHQSGHNGVDVLRESAAQEAAFDSDFRRYAPSCFPGTRVQHIEDIVNWATAQSTFPIYRMTGPAGVGKSAIAQTCAEELRSQYQLGASFFFTIHGCTDYYRLFPSISYQLSSKSPNYHELLNKKLQLDSTLVRKQLRSQFRELIVEPLRELEQAGKHIGRKVILIDGLDECKDKDAQREIIEIVVSSVATQSTPFYWAFFSRPEPQIEAAFADPGVSSLCISTFLPISRGLDGEIELYLRSGLQDILRRRGIPTSDPWPPDQDVHSLIFAAQGLYIYAATILRFVGRTDTQYDPQELLHMVVKGSTQSFDGPSMRTPFEELDAFYTLILQRVPGEMQSSVQLLLSLIVSHLSALEIQAGAGIRFVSNALGITETKVKMLCSELIAIVCYTKFCAVPSVQLSPRREVYAREEWLSFYHKSFFDFICDPIRSGPFCVTTLKMRNKLFEHLLELQIGYSMSYSFQNNGGLNSLANDSDANIGDARCGLSWPFDSELLNSTMRALVFEYVGILLLDRFFPYRGLDNQLLRRFGHVDHRKYFMIQTWTYKENVHLPGSNFGFDCIIKNVQGAILCSTAHQNMPSFDAGKFRKGISRLEGAQVIRRYQPSSTILEPPLFRYDSDGNALSGLYIKGHGQMSTFWYWYLDPEMRYYREFETVDLAEGERIFREENFELWPMSKKEAGMKLEMELETETETETGMTMEVEKKMKVKTEVEAKTSRIRQTFRVFS